MSDEPDNFDAVIELCAKLAELRGRELGEAGIGSDIAETIRDAERCIACDLPFVRGDHFYRDKDGGHIHASCAGTDQEGFVDAEDEPLGPNDPIPEPSIWGPT